MKALTHNDRGAVLLLTVYLSALTLLLLGGISLQRTNTEVRASQLSRDLEQAFWHSEAAIDNYLARVSGESFVAGSEYPADGLGSSATFNAMPVAAEILMQAAENSNVFMSGKNVVRFNQDVTRKVSGTGTSAGGIQAHSSAYVREEGPLRGVWANKTIAVAGGRDIDPEEKILYGDLHSGLGSVVSVIKENGTLDKLAFDGLIKVGEEAQSSWDGKLDYWAAQASDDLLSIKNGYAWIQGAVENLDQVGGSYSDVQFVSGPAATATAHVTGSLSVGQQGALDLVVNPNLTCTGTIYLNSSSVTVNDGMFCMSEGRYDTGMRCDGMVWDLDQDPNRITLCVNAIVPATGQQWLDTLMDRPPVVRFSKPATILVTGSHPLSTAGLHAYIPAFNSLVSTDVFANPLFKGTPLYVQTQWRVAVGAQLEAYNGVQPASVRILQQQIDPALLAQLGATPRPPGLMFIKPGNEFKGAIYSPDSLVVIRARSCSVDDSCSGPLAIQYVVGNEVAIELEGDKIQIGEMVLEEDEGEAAVSHLQGWVGH